MDYLSILFFFVLGLLFGSFASALSFRIPRGIDFISGRSFCPRCKKSILWFDNIPLLSFFYLKGRTRCCRKKISLRYPLIEASLGLLFALSFLLLQNVKENVEIFKKIGVFSLPFLLLIVFLCILIFVIDAELMIIPDEIIFFGLFFALLALLSGDIFWPNLVAGFASSLFLLFLNLVTKGRGMGMGDVKLALLMGTILGLKLSFIFVLFSFVIGGFFGVFVICMNLASLKDKIAFGPFLVVSFLLTLFFVDRLILLI